MMMMMRVIHHASVLNLFSVKSNDGQVERFKSLNHHDKNVTCLYNEFEILKKRSKNKKTYVKIMFLPSDFYILKEKNLFFFSSISPGEGFICPPRVKQSHESTTTDGISATNTHEVLIETKTKLRKALTVNKSTEETRQIQIIKIIHLFS